jgi:MFS family permease
MIFAIIQGVDASIAFISGYTYDKLGIKFLMVPFILSIFPSLITLISKDLSMIILACVFFGVVLGMQESIYRAVIADMTPLDSRGTAYGIFYTVYGLGGLLGGGVVYGLFIDYGTNMVLIAVYAVLSQIVAISLLMRCKIR